MVLESKYEQSNLFTYFCKEPKFLVLVTQNTQHIEKDGHMQTPHLFLRNYNKHHI